MASDLAETMHYIGERWKFNSKEYPPLKKLSDRQKQTFAIKHIVFHMQKSLGGLAIECEAHDHGSEMNEAALDEAAVKMLINTLRLTQELRMTAAYLIEAVPKLMKS